MTSQRTRREEEEEEDSDSDDEYMSCSGSEKTRNGSTTIDNVTSTINSSNDEGITTSMDFAVGEVSIDGSSGIASRDLSMPSTSTMRRTRNSRIKSSDSSLASIDQSQPSSSISTILTTTTSSSTTEETSSSDIAVPSDYEVIDKYRLALIINNALQMGDAALAEHVMHGTIGIYQKVAGMNHLQLVLDEWEDNREPLRVLLGEDRKHLESLKSRSHGMNDVFSYLHITKNKNKSLRSAPVLALFGPERDIVALTDDLNDLDTSEYDDSIVSTSGNLPSKGSGRRRKQNRTDDK